MNTKRFFSRQDIVKLVLPLMIDLTLTLLVGMIDSIMVASVGEDAVSGVSLIDNVMQLLILVFSAFGTGGAVVAGQFLGAGKEETACKTTTELIWFSGIVSVGLMALMYASKGFILNHLFGSITPEVYYHADRYLFMTALSIPAISLYQSGVAIFRTMNQSQKTMQLSIYMNVINVAGNAFFIYKCGWGTFGAALSTTIARYVAAVIAVAILLDQKKLLHLKRSIKYIPDMKLVKKILSIGVPSGVENGLFQLGKIMILSLVSKFGTAAIAANSIATLIATIECIPGNAMQLAGTTMIARCVGANDEEQTRYYNRIVLAISYVAMAVISLIIVIFLKPILGWYHLSEEAYVMTRNITWLHAAGAVLMWTPTFVLPSSLRAAGDVKFAMIVSVISMMGIRIAMSYVLAWYFQMGAFGVWVAMLFDWLFRMTLFIWRWRSGKWRGKSVVGV